MEKSESAQKRVTLKIADFHDIFMREKNSEIPLYIKKQVNLVMYKRIISKFLFIYVKELIFGKKPMYFFLTGKIQLNRCGGWIGPKSFLRDEGLVKASHSLGFFWYEKQIPGLRLTKLKKSVGSTNPLPLMEKEYESKNDISLLPKAYELKKIYKQNIKYDIKK